MATLRHIHQYMTHRRRVQLDDGRTGCIVRVDTNFPENTTTVSIWTGDGDGPSVAKVGLERVVGPVKKSIPA